MMQLLSLAEAQELHFVTGDLRLYNAVKNELSWVI
jgi:predicted nucleic acid-binding protein